MLAATRRETYEIPFGGRAQFQYAADVVAAIDRPVPEAAGTITYTQDVKLPLPEDMEASQPVTTPLRQGMLETIELFRRASR